LTLSSFKKVFLKKIKAKKTVKGKKQTKKKKEKK